MKKMMYLLFVFSLIPVVAVSADDFIDNRLQVNNSRLETEKEKDTWGQLDATESLFNEGSEKIADENASKETIDRFRRPVVFCYKGKEKQGLKRTCSSLKIKNYLNLSPMWRTIRLVCRILFQPCKCWLGVSFSFGIAGYISIESIEKRPKWTNISMSPSV